MNSVVVIPLWHALLATLGIALAAGIPSAWLGARIALRMCAQHWE